MRAKSMLLCKAPFTPRYDNLVTGCTAQELYTTLVINGIQFPFSSIKTQFLETESKLKFSFILSTPTIPQQKIDLSNYNYIAFKDDTNNITFYFIDTWSVENAFEYPTVTIECTKDFWHTYCLDLTIDKIYKQNIIKNHVKMTANGDYDYDRPNYFTSSPYPHRTSFIINDRVLWAKVKINTIYSQDGTVDLAQQFGFPFDGNNLTVYVPLFFINSSNDVVSEIGYINYYNNSNSVGKLQLIELPIDKDDIATATEDIEPNTLRTVDAILSVQQKIENLSSHPMVIDIELTFIPPFEYQIDSNDTVLVNIDYDENDSYYKCNADINNVDGVTMFKFGGLFDSNPAYERYYEIEYDTSIIRTNNPDEYNMLIPPNINRYCILGTNKIEIPIQCKKVKFRLTFNNSTDGYSASIYFDNLRYTYNIISSPNSKISLSRNKASTEEALYGSSYRDSSFIRGLISSTLSFGGSITNMVNSIEEGDKGNIISDLSNSVKSFGGVAETYNSYYRAYSTPDNITNGFVLAGSTIFGDFPYILNEIIYSQYYSDVLFTYKKYGEDCNFYGYVTDLHRDKFSYVKTANTILYSSYVSTECNYIISSILNRGVHLWNLKNLSSLFDIGNYSITNTEV